MNKKLILLIEDNKRLNAFNKRMLEMNGYTAEAVTTLAEARGSLTRRRPDAIVLDIGMPDGNGLDFLAELRQTSDIPALLLTGNSKNQDITLGFQRGCNDYLPKPYHFDVLLARLKNMLQSAEQVPEMIRKGTLTLKTTSMTLYLNNEEQVVSQKEFFLLLFFIQNENRVMSTEHLYEHVWGQTMNDDDSAVKNAVSRLRKKLESSGYTIPFLRGEGYCFEREK